MVPHLEAPSTGGSPDCQIGIGFGRSRDPPEMGVLVERRSVGWAGQQLGQQFGRFTKYFRRIQLPMAAECR